MRRDEAMQMLDQLETMMGECEKHQENMPTMRSFLMVARVCYLLLMDRAKKGADYNKWNEEWTRQ